MNHIVNDRKAHQPKPGPVSRPIPNSEQLAQACGGTVALILATNFGTTPLKVAFEDPEKEPIVCGSDEENIPRPLQRFEGKPLIAHVAECVAETKFASAFALVGGTDEQRAEVESALEGQNVSPIGYDADDAYRSTIDACGFTLYDLPKGVLDYAKQALDAMPEADSAMIVSCDQVRITPAHLFEICKTFRNDPALDVVASWIQWYRRTPMLISRRFLDSLSASGLCEAGPDGIDRPLPRIALKDVIFGEETLAANDVVPERLERFKKERTLSAREAIRIAREEASKNDSQAEETAEAEGDFGGLHKASSAAKRGLFERLKAPEASNRSRHTPKRSAADEELIEVARTVANRMDAWRAQLPPKERDKLDWADAWAWRNREDFPLLNDRKQKNTLAYLDSAATTQRCFRALQAEANFNEHENANVYRGGYELSANATEYLNDARKALEDFIGADRRQTVYTMNASASCNLVAQSWGDFNVNEGDHIVVALSEHHSDLLPWLLLARRRNATLDLIPLLPDGRLDLDEYRRLMEAHPKLVCVAHVSNVLGIINPVADMARMAHDAGARFMLDAAQSFPHLPFNVKEIGCDFAAFSAHKMYGPLGIGGLFIGKNAFAEMDPVAIGGGTISYASTDSYYLRQGAIQYEVGTPPIAQAIGWAGAIEYMKSLGMGHVLEHAEAMTRFAAHALHGMEGLTIWGDHTKPDGAGGLLSFSLANVTPPQIGKTCGMMGVAVRSGGHCAMPLAASTGMVGTGRASFAVHTTCEDIEALAVAVEMCRRLYR